jgi:uncharacterized protein YdhG (YjbR/CyaY superfamily)
MPTFWKGQNIIHFAAAKKHIGLYPGAKRPRCSGNSSKGTRSAKARSACRTTKNCRSI